MPTYEYQCTKCGKHHDRILSVAKRNDPLNEDCPFCDSKGHIKMVLGSNPIADPVRLGRIKPPAGFNEVLRNIKAVSPGSNMNIRD